MKRVGHSYHPTVVCIQGVDESATALLAKMRQIELTAQRKSAQHLTRRDEKSDCVVATIHTFVDVRVTLAPYMKLRATRKQEASHSLISITMGRDGVEGSLSSSSSCAAPETYIHPSVLSQPDCIQALTGGCRAILEHVRHMRRRVRRGCGCECTILLHP